MKLKSVKFGGTSIKNKKAIDHCCDIVKKNIKQYKVIVTVSAITRVTDILYEIIDLSLQSKFNAVQSRIRYISSLHKTILYKILDGNYNTHNIWLQSFQPLIQKLLLLCHDTTPIKKVTDHSIAQISSFGERLSSLIVAIALNQRKLSNTRIESEKIIKTNNNYLKAKINIKMTTISAQKILYPLLQKNIIPIITGFIARDNSGDITSLGRGGSDYTASILGIALNANLVEIWTDVDGIMTADPHIVNNACSWETIDIHTAQNMAYCGANIIHPDAIAAVHNNIPVYIFNTFNPHFKGTKITHNNSSTKGIVLNANNILIKLEKQKTINFMRNKKEIFDIINTYNILIDIYDISDVIFVFSITVKDYAHKLLKYVHQYEGLELNFNVVQLSIIAHKIHEDNLFIANICYVVAQLNIEVYAINLSALNNKIVILVERDKAIQCSIAVHNTLLQYNLI